jgi:hypothetical protein
MGLSILLPVRSLQCSFHAGRQTEMRPGFNRENPANPVAISFKRDALSA